MLHYVCSWETMEQNIHELAAKKYGLLTAETCNSCIHRTYKDVCSLRDEFISQTFVTLLELWNVANPNFPPRALQGEFQALPSFLCLMSFKRNLDSKYCPTETHLQTKFQDRYCLGRWSGTWKYGISARFDGHRISLQTKIKNITFVISILLNYEFADTPVLKPVIEPDLQVLPSASHPKYSVFLRYVLMLFSSVCFTMFQMNTLQVVPRQNSVSTFCFLSPSLIFCSP